MDDKLLSYINASFCDNKIGVTKDSDTVVLTAPESTENGFFELRFELPKLTGDEYVLFPACCYNGNRFRVLRQPYPPYFTYDEASPKMEIMITDVPRLEKDGSGEIEVTTGDLSVPCVGIFSHEKKKAILIFTTQEINEKNFGLSYHTGCVTISYPHMRKKKMYRHPMLYDSTDKGIPFLKGESITIPYKIIEFDCENIHELFRVFFENRKCMGMDAEYSPALSPKMIWKVHEDKYNFHNYNEQYDYYMVGIDKTDYQCWQPGWTGGAISTYPLMKLGSNLSYKRSISTLRFLFANQAESGFFEGVINYAGHKLGDHFLFDDPKYENWHLLRKSADILYYIFKHFDVMKEKGDTVPAEFIEGTRKLADGFVNMWQRYGQLGQFIHLETGDIITGNSTSAALAPAGLALSWRFFDDIKYLEAAKAIAHQYYERDLSNGYTTGGPAEIIQCPDSESAFALLESFVVLYEMTRDNKWLEYAEESAANCSSWVVPYNYKFPSYSEFARLGIKSIGSVFANVQNKHSSPGICTMSGHSLYRLYKYTNDSLYLELISDIAKNIFQYLPREDRPIFSWDDPPQRLVNGAMCERVNMSDWEDYPKIGGVFYGSCWCEISSMLTIVELPDLLDS